MTKDKKQELKIEAIENGTVIDHITANKSLHILKILGLPDNETQNITIAMNVSSSEIGIRNFEPVKKDKIILPDKITSIIECTNPKCITNYENEPIKPVFNVINKYPPVVRCHYCEKLIRTEDIDKQFE